MDVVESLKRRSLKNMGDDVILLKELASPIEWNLCLNECSYFTAERIKPTRWFPRPSSNLGSCRTAAPAPCPAICGRNGIIIILALTPFPHSSTQDNTISLA